MPKSRKPVLKSKGSEGKRTDLVLHNHDLDLVDDTRLSVARVKDRAIRDADAAFEKFVGELI